MRYIAINTAAPIIEIVACYDEQKKFASMQKVMAAESLLPALDTMLDEMKLGLRDFDYFVCVVGPGSFTGIRIGINTVRTLAYALEKSAYGVTYNRVMAYNISDGCAALVDGGNGVCYAAVYNGDQTIAEPICIYKKDALEFVQKHGFAAISDFDIGKRYIPDGEALSKAAEYAINNKTGTEAVYIRKPQPDRTGSEI